MTDNVSKVELLELIFPAGNHFGFDERDEIEDALGAALTAKGMGCVSCAGAGLGVMELGIDLDERVQEDSREALELVQSIVRAFKPPAGSYLVVHTEETRQVPL